MITWPDLKLPPINLWSLPYANQSRRFTDAKALGNLIKREYNSSLTIKKEKLLYVRGKIWEINSSRTGRKYTSKKENCIWATRAEQNRNKRGCLKYRVSEEDIGRAH